MSGLPPIPRPKRNVSPWYWVMVRGVEDLTKALMEGRGFDDAALNDLDDFARRYTAFVRALDARKKAAGIMEDTNELG